MTYPDFDAIDPRRSIVWLPFDGSFRQDVGESLQPQVCRSLSELPGALDYARLGDGYTAARMPTQRSGGLTFNGTQSINLDWSPGGALDAPVMTFICYATPEAFTVANRLFEIGINGQKYVLFFDAASGVYIFTSTTGALTLASPEGYRAGTSAVFAVTVDHVGVDLYRDDVLLASVSGDHTLSSFDPASKAMIGAYPNSFSSGSYCFKGDMYSAAIFPFALSATQVREVGRRMRQLRNIR